jgi:hypothetical protein
MMCSVLNVSEGILLENFHSYRDTNELSRSDTSTYAQNTFIFLLLDVNFRTVS